MIEEIWKFLYAHLGDAISFIIGIGVLAPFLLKARILIKKIAKLIVDIDAILEDNSISNDEIAKIKADSLDIWNEIKSWSNKGSVVK